MAINGISGSTPPVQPELENKYKSSSVQESETTTPPEVERFRESQDDREQPQEVNEAELEQRGDPVARADSTESVTTGQAQVNAVDSSAQKANVAIAVGSTIDIKV